MKKLPLILISLFTGSLLLTGCSTAPEPPTLHSAVDTDAVVRFGSTDYQCHLCYVNRNTATLTILSPKTLSNFSVIRSDGDHSFSLGSLLCKNNFFLPSDSMAEKVFSALDTLSETELVSEGQNKDGSFTFQPKEHPDSLSVITDKNGFPLKLQNDQLIITLSPENNTEIISAS